MLAMIRALTERERIKESLHAIQDRLDKLRAHDAPASQRIEVRTELLEEFLTLLHRLRSMTADRSA
jgi:hypothetical protein